MRRTLTFGLASVALVGLGLATTSLASAAGPTAPAAKPTVPVSAQPATAGPTSKPLVEPMTAAPATVRAGDRVTVSGQHCAPGKPVFFSLGSDRRFDLGELKADRDGTYHGTVRIPAGAKAGTDTLWAGCRAPNPTGKLLHDVTLTITR
jgi:hypothetical protein